MSKFLIGWQLTITLEGGNIVEKYKLEEKDKEWQTVRSVASGVMTSVSSVSVSIRLNDLMGTAVTS